MRHSKRELARQAVVIAQEGPQPLAELAELAGVSERTLIRWACKGKGGVFLDATKDGGTWYSSRAAVERFVRATAREEAAA